MRTVAVALIICALAHPALAQMHEPTFDLGIDWPSAFAALGWGGIVAFGLGGIAVWLRA